MTGFLDPKSSERDNNFCVILVVYLEAIEIFHPVEVLFFPEISLWERSYALKFRNLRN